MEKNKFWMLVWALIPGAGEMYMGLMKKGIAVATLFWGSFALMATLNFSLFSFILPIVWFYSFFDTLNLKSLNYEKRIEADDKFGLEFAEFLGKDWKCGFSKRHLLIGGICIVVGFQMIMTNFISPILWEVENMLPWVRRIIHGIPTLILSFVIICFGIYLIKGKKVYSDNDDEKELVEFKGDDNE